MTTPFKDLIKPLTSSKLGDVYVKGALRFKKIACDNALVGAELNLTDADFIFFDENSTATGATMSVDDEGGPQLPIGPLRGMRDMPMKRAFITCGAQPGKVLNAWWGKGVYIYGAQPAGKGAWYDRNANPDGQNFLSASTAPHAPVTRWTYTVPAAKKTMVESIVCFTQRQTVAAPVGLVQAYIVSSGLPTLQAYMGYAQLIANTIGETCQGIVGGAQTFIAGQQVQGKTGDPSTGGTVSYNLSIKVTEFDA